MPLVRQGPGLVGTAARAGVAAEVAGRVRRRQQQKWAAQGQAVRSSRRRRRLQEQAARLHGRAEKLANLRDGAYHAEDYEAKKKQLLGI